MNIVVSQALNNTTVVINLLDALDGQNQTNVELTLMTATARKCAIISCTA